MALAVTVVGCAPPGTLDPGSVSGPGSGASGIVVESLTVTQTQAPPQSLPLRSDCGVVVAARFSEAVRADRLEAIVSLHATGTDRWFVVPVGLLRGDPGLRTPFLWIGERYGDSFDRVRLQVLGPDDVPSVVGTAPVSVTCPHEGSRDTWAALSGRVVSVALEHFPSGYGFGPDVHCAVRAVARLDDVASSAIVAFRFHSQLWGTWYETTQAVAAGDEVVFSVPLGVLDSHGDAFDRVTAVLAAGKNGPVISVASAATTLTCPWRPTQR